MRRGTRSRLAGLAVLLGAFVACDDVGGLDPADTEVTADGGSDGAGGNIPRDAAVRDAALPKCSDGLDNDRDGKIDLEDPGCTDADDDDERDLSACEDGVDNDLDGYIDFPADPGCGSLLDDDELNDAVAPQCNDGIDNDRDGLIDEEDPGCSSVADPREDDPNTPPQCHDGLDNDDNGIIDFPNDPGCSTAGDDEEVALAQPPACADAVDNDNDGKTDYPNDPGCAGVGDRDEADRPIAPGCADGADNDGDGKIDFPDDYGCHAAGDTSERGTCGEVYDPPLLSDGQTVVTDLRRGAFEAEGSCGGRGAPEVVFFYRLTRTVEALEVTTVHPETTVATTLYARRAQCLSAQAEVGCVREEAAVASVGNTLRLTNLPAGDYYLFVDGVASRGGPVGVTVREIPLAQCLNGIDDDDDGRIDYPTEPGCESPDDRDETDPDVLGACSNDEDDDADGFIDYPLDVGCVSAGFGSENDRCGNGIRFRELFYNQTSVMGDTRVDRGGTNAFQGSCGGQNVPEVVYYFDNPATARVVLNTRYAETVGSTVVYVRRACTDRASELDCDEGAEMAAGNKGRVVIENMPVGPHYIVVDTRLGVGGPFKLTMEYTRLAAACADGIDNDADAQIDGEDPGCESAADDDERDPQAGVPLAVCNNGEDDDGDGLVDFPFDPGCQARGAGSEVDPEDPAACGNGLDDDDDGIIDFPLDPGCQSAGDIDETDPRPRPACSNRIDDDRDDRVDYPFDPGCISAGDGSEVDPMPIPDCFDGVDNDRDGIADFPFDPGCISAGHPFEDDRPAGFEPVCSDGLDNDGDGLPDFPRDPGCEYAADPDEANPGLLPQCANRMDDDQDGRIDFPDDPGCRFAADRTELNQGAIPPRCSDGVDNDFDGFIDLQDPGCLEPLDDDESDDPDPLPECANGIDDDGDGMIDWPADGGCRARGDLTESQSCRPSTDTPLIPRNGTVSGSTLDGGSDVYFHRCGGREAPDAVYRYVLGAPANLTFSAANPSTDYPVVIAVRTDCEEPTSMVSCAGNFAAPEPTVTLRNAEPGEYFVFIDGGGPEQWVSRGGNVVMPADPQNFVGQNDIQDNCGWSDGGNDAFDCYGTFTVTHAGVQSTPGITVGTRNAVAGAYNYRVISSKPHPNLWRVQLLPAIDFDERPVTVQVTGNLGSDGGTQARPLSAMLQGRNIAALYTSDGGQFDPPVTHLMLPSDPEQFGQVSYANQQDNVTIRAVDVKLPVTFYVGITYASGEASLAAMLTDVDIQAGPAGNDAPRFGNFELSVTEQ